MFFFLIFSFLHYLCFLLPFLSWLIWPFPFMLGVLFFSFELLIFANRRFCCHYEAEAWGDSHLVSMIHWALSSTVWGGGAVLARCAFCRCVHTLAGHGDWQGTLWDAATDALLAFGGISAGLFSEASFSKQVCSTQLLGERCLALGILGAVKALTGWALLREANKSSLSASKVLTAPPYLTESSALPGPHVGSITVQFRQRKISSSSQGFGR